MSNVKVKGHCNVVKNLDFHAKLQNKVCNCNDIW